MKRIAVSPEDASGRIIPGISGWGHAAETLERFNLAYTSGSSDDICFTVRTTQNSLKLLYPKVAFYRTLLMLLA